ncbi:mechanosensitive ion channel family protein [Thiosocius teredinicola]|uniref:mechanosensitive ion channel family protein n=1 Tax=Thiosocius teredinicola TaxID=1973002 RepID=UPI000F7715DB
MTVWLRAVLLVLLATLATAGACLAEAGFVDEKETGKWSDSASKRLKEISADLQKWKDAPPAGERLSEAQSEVLKIRERAEQCVADFSAHLASVKERLAALGEPGEKAASEIQATQKKFEKDQQDIEQQLAVCRLTSIGARDLRNELTAQWQAMVSRQLLHHDKDIWETTTDVLVNGLSFDSTKKIGFEPWPALGAGALLLAILTPIALMLSRMLRGRFPMPDPETANPPQRSTILADLYSRRLPWLAVGLTVVVTLYLAGAAPLAAFGAALLISACVAPLIQLLVCQGKLNCAESVPARLLLDLVLVAGALVLMGAHDYLPGDAVPMLRALFLLALVGVAGWLMRKLYQRDDLSTLRSLRLPIGIALLAGPTADWLGYPNLGMFLTLGIYGTAVGVLLVWLGLSLIGHLFDSLKDSDAESQSALRKRLGYSRGEKVPGVGMLHWVVRIGALVGLGYWLLYAWQVSESDTALVRDVLHQGFQVGAVRIVPSKLILALLSFLVLLSLARWLRTQLGERWLTRTNLDSGARQSVVSLTSYAIVGIAIMLALSMAGLDFQNLAIVAGALSVGIGFGLQNIVNNFVSGLILLFERPVRPGDWVVVGQTQGYVRKVSIRYTLIQTFDRAEVLVPNSELISNQVTNLTLSDPFGRVIVPVGVAYGSDTRQVRDILQKVAREHPLTVLHDPRVSPPQVFFMDFGDSSLNFELRFFIRNIDYKLSAKSDALFAIDDAFREAGIEIPFPQRVVHRPAGEPVETKSESAQIPGKPGPAEKGDKEDEDT